MQVFLIRHAEAVDETLELRDPSRHLTPFGRTQARALGERMRWHDCVPTHVWTSPLVRAVQTAELVTSSMHSEAPVEVVPPLAVVSSTREVVALVRALPGDASVMLVGHEPSISTIGALLVDDPAFEALAKAQAVRILDGAVRWRFAWDDEAAAPKR